MKISAFKGTICIVLIFLILLALEKRDKTPIKWPDGPALRK